MAGGLTVSVRQVASYPVSASLTANDLVLAQSAGLGGPYVAATPQALIAPLATSAYPLVVGYAAPANLAGGQTLTGVLLMPTEGTIAWNSYIGSDGAAHYLASGVTSSLFFDPPGGLSFEIFPTGEAGGVINTALGSTLFSISPAGAMSLNYGTLRVARDPASALEVATMGWVGNQTVASFNNRKGVVTLSAADIYGALGICPPDQLATQCSVDAAICAAINDLLRTYPGVWSWMGRVGDVFLTVADMNFAAANNPAFMPPLTIPEPPSTAVDGEAVNAAWVISYVTTLLAGPPAYATQDWVAQQLAALNVGVSSWNGRQGAVTLTALDLTNVGGALLVSPNFLGVPSAPTAAPGTSDGQLATTAFVQAAVTAATVGVASFNTRTGAVVLDSTDINDAGGALLTSPNFLGTPTAPTPSAGDSSQRLATTAFVELAVAGATAGVSSWNGRLGAVTLQLADVEAVGGAPIASPGFSGIPTAPTAANGTNTTQLATTAFVQNELTAIGAGVLTWNGRSGNVVLTQNDLSAVGGLYNPNAALTGTPTAPTAAPNDNSTKIATTAYVANAIQGAAVTSFNGRSGTVTLSLADITGAGGAPAASPALTGTPTAPTAALGNSSTLIATTAFVANTLAGYLPLTGGVLSGPLSLAGNATQPLQAVPLQQLSSTLGGYLPLSGGTLTGNLTGTTATFTGLVASPAVVVTNPSGAAMQIGAIGAGVTSLTIGQQGLGLNALSLNGNGNLAVAGSFNCTAIGASGAINTSTNITVGNNAIVTGGISAATAQFGTNVIIGAQGINYTAGGNFYALSGTATAINLLINGASGWIVSGSPGGYQAATQLGFAPNFAYGVIFNAASIYSFTVSPSDRKLKSNIVAAGDGLSVVNAIPVHALDFKYPQVPEASHWNYSLITDEVTPQLPEAVIPAPTEPGITGYEALDLQRLVACLWRAVQQLSAKVAALEPAPAA